MKGMVVLFSARLTAEGQKYFIDVVEGDGRDRGCKLINVKACRRELVRVTGIVADEQYQGRVPMDNW